jgi:hypothetical protein
MIYVPTFKRYVGALAPVRFTFIEDQERSICAVDGDVPMGGRRVIKSTIVKRTIVIAGHKTSVSLEDEFWNALKVIAGERDMRAWELVTSINSNRRTTICHWRFAFSYSTTIKARSATRLGARHRMETTALWRVAKHSAREGFETYPPQPSTPRPGVVHF